MGRVIVITSGKGGVGKTTATAYIGMSLARAKRVVLVDADIGLNNLDVAMGVENNVVYDLGDVIDGRARLSQALIRDALLPNLFILASSKLLPEGTVTSAVLKRIVDELRKSFDYVLIDCPAGIENGFHRAVSVADEAIVVTTPHISAVRDADKVLTLLHSYDVKLLGLVVSRIKEDQITKGRMMSPEDISRLLRVAVLGAVEDDDKLMVVQMLGRIEVETKAVRSYRRIAEKLLPQEEDVDDEPWYAKLWNRLKNA